jgi:hypothetical protein
MKAERSRSKIIVMPKISWGLCRRRSCGISSDLANGLCQYHWDKTMDDKYIDCD